MSRVPSLRLLAELRVASVGSVVLLVALQIVWAAMTPVAAAATGFVVAQASGGPAAALGGALLAFALALWLGESVGHALWLVRANIARVIDGSIRSEVRRLLGRAASMETVEDPQLRDDVAHVMSTGGARGYEQSLGTAAGAQLARWFDVVEILAVAAVLAPVSPWFALSGVGLVLVLRWVMQRTHQREADGESDDARGLRRTAYWTQLGTGAAAAKEIRIFGMGDWVAQRRRSEAESYLLPRWQRHLPLMRGQALVGVAIAAAGIWVVGVPVWAASVGRIDAAGLARSLVAAFGLIYLVSRMGLGWNIAYGHVVLAALARVRTRLAAPAADPAQISVGPATEVVLRDVRFAYGHGPAVLDGLELRIAPGEVVAVVGPNGAGKTTLMKLLAGLDAATTGVVHGPTRSQVTVLFSDFVRYPLPLRDNVSLAAPEVDPDVGEIERCLELAGAADLAARWPAGLDTPLSASVAGGVDLSGGQWQKVALARAVFGARHGRTLLIMDEPTAHLDAGQEADFYDRVVRTLSGVTIVLVSHRLSTVRSADRIVLLEAGRIREQGTHRDLIAAGGEYARMFALQARRFERSESAAGSATGEQVR